MRNVEAQLETQGATATTLTKLMLYLVADACHTWRSHAGPRTQPGAMKRGTPIAPRCCRQPRPRTTTKGAMTTPLAEMSCAVRVDDWPESPIIVMSRVYQTRDLASRSLEP